MNDDTPPNILNIIFNEEVSPVGKDLEKALTYVGPVAYHIGWNVEQTIEALDYFTQVGIPIKKAGTSLRHLLLKLDSLEDEFNPMIHTFSEILPELSKLSKNEIEKTFGRAGAELWKVITVYQDLQDAGLKGAEAGTKLREITLKQNK